MTLHLWTFLWTARKSAFHQFSDNSPQIIDYFLQFIAISVVKNNQQFDYYCWLLISLLKDYPVTSGRSFGAVYAFDLQINILSHEYFQYLNIPIWSLYTISITSRMPSPATVFQTFSFLEEVVCSSNPSMCDSILLSSNIYFTADDIILSLQKWTYSFLTSALNVSTSIWQQWQSDSWVGGMLVARTSCAASASSFKLFSSGHNSPHSFLGKYLFILKLKFFFLF